MKKGIHPPYMETQVKCGCGETFVSRSTRDKISVEICSKCHPFYTGKQKFVDAAGMVERFQRKYNWGKKQEEKAAAAAGATPAAPAAPSAPAAGA